MKTIVVTAGQEYTDIDALACAIAYAELLNLEGKKAEAILPGALNHSVTNAVKQWGLNFKVEPADSDFVSVLVDTSHLENFASFVKEDSIFEIYDHHYGAIEYWNEKLKEHSHIEMVGACATLIWEEYKKRGLYEEINTITANLLLTAIISNTLNFGAQITHDRDIVAFNELKKYSSLPDYWIDSYFTDQEISVYQDIENSIKGDTKIVKVPTFEFPIVIPQMELWDSKKCLLDNKETIKETIEGFNNPYWVVTLPSISEKINYLYSENQELKNIFSNCLEAEWDGDIGVTKKLWLRKEIRKKLYEYKD